MKKASVIGIGDAGKYVINKIVEKNSLTQTIFLNIKDDDIKDCKADFIINVNEQVEKIC